MENSVNFTKPKLVESDKKSGWYVYFRYNKRLKRYKLGINRIKDIAERRKEGRALARVLHEKLKNGWNPFGEVKATNKNMLFTEAMDFGLEKKKKYVAKKTYSGYSGTVSFTKEAIEKLSLNYLAVHEVKRVHIKTIFEKAQILNNWSNKSYNKNLNYLSAVLDELLEWDILEYNPVHKIKRLPEEESTANETASDSQHKEIKTKLSSDHPYFFNFIKTLYHTGIRPKEILSIQLHMIDLNSSEIRLPPKITKSGTKKRNVTINKHLWELLSSMDLSMYPKDFYLFGSYRESGRGNVGKFIDFIPGPTKIKRDTATKRWKKIVKDGLSIDVNMYSYKHKGGDDKLKAGVDLDSIRNQYGHSETKMTERYAKEIKGIYKKDIIDKSPEF